jgi:pimeloyl-ACP methyl ester carboxylesterase
LIDEAEMAKTLNAARAAATRQFLTPRFVRQELKDDPVQYLTKVHVPVLALVGSLDRTVPAGPYVDAMRPVLASIPGSEVRVLPGLNHVMQTARTGSPQEFGTIEETIAPVALETIDVWVARQVHTSSRK